MRVRWPARLLPSVVLFAALGAAPAQAGVIRVPQLTAPSAPVMPQLSGTGRIGAKPPTGGSVQTVGTPSAQSPPSHRGRSGTKAITKKLTFRCHELRRRHGHRRWRCVARYRGRHKVLRRCSARTRHRAVKRCRRALGITAGATRLGANRPPRAHAAALNWQGWPNPGDVAVGKIISDLPDRPGYVENCSGTVVARSLVLTAGHCVTEGGHAVGRIRFFPGAEPGTVSDPTSLDTPFGEWDSSASTAWVPNAWLDTNDPAQDWALIEFGPDASGRFVGDYTGTWSVTANIAFSGGAHIVAEGYPQHGFWETPDGYQGRAQYACNSTWNNDSSDGWRYLDQSGDWELFLSCTMNQGSSGGPWFVQLNDGTWTIGGINNRCAGNETATDYCNPYALWIRSTYIDNKFLAFWNAVQPLLHY